nr:hypothetical protein CFP56_56098 [Quercus suber]
MGDGLGGTESVGQTFVPTPSLAKAATPVVDSDRNTVPGGGNTVNTPHMSYMEVTDPAEDNPLPIITNNGSNPEVINSAPISSSFLTNPQDFDLQIQEIDTALMKFDHQTSDPLCETAGSPHILESHEYDPDLVKETQVTEAQNHCSHVAIPNQESTSETNSLRKWKKMARDTHMMTDQTSFSTATKRGRETEEDIQPELPTKKLQVVPGFEDAKVLDLINPISRKWEIDLIRGLFLPEEVELILSIPLSHRPTEDKVIWPYNSSGAYSVKSGTKFLAKENNISIPRVDQLHEDGTWKRIWSLSIPNKVRNFLWRACHNAIPVKQNLVRRKIITEDMCEQCNLNSETFAIDGIKSELAHETSQWRKCYPKLSKL